VGELHTIVDYSYGAPCVNPIFGLTQSFNYWSSSSYAGYPFLAWSVPFDDGLDDATSKTYFPYVRAVRSGSD